MRVEVDSSKCTGCGTARRVCRLNAIEIDQIHHEGLWERLINFLARFGESLQRETPGSRGGMGRGWRCLAKGGGRRAGRRQGHSGAGVAAASDKGVRFVYGRISPMDTQPFGPLVVVIDAPKRHHPI